MKINKCGIDVHLYLANQKAERRKELLQERNKMETYLEDLLTDIAAVFKVEMNLVKSDDRQTGVVMVRKIFFYIARIKGKYGYKAITKALGRSDHTNCLYHIAKVRAFLKVGDPEFLAVWDYYLEHSKLYTKNDFI